MDGLNYSQVRNMVPCLELEIFKREVEVLLKWPSFDKLNILNTAFWVTLKLIKIEITQINLLIYSKDIKLYILNI